MRTLLICFFIVSTLFGAKNIDGQIKLTSSKLKKYDRKYSSTNHMLAKTANAILKEKRKLSRHRKRLESLQLELSLKENSYKNNKSELSRLTTTQDNLSKEQSKIEDALIFSIARNASLSLLIDDDRVVSADALITEAVLSEMSHQTRLEINTLNKKLQNNKQRIEQLKKRSSSIKNDIDLIDKKRIELAKTKRKTEASLKKLNAQKKRYKKDIKKFIAQQKALTKTLASLHIIKESEAEKAAREKEEKERNKRLAAKQTPSKNLPHVKHVASSYQKAKTKRYTGKKTIAPLSSYKLVKKYGTYTDPIYNIKIFNESVSLKSTTPNAKVKNVLNGKVILATSNPVLENIVIIEHSNGLHTIYAHLDKIAPTIKKGKKVKTGSIIGRVSSELMFEVTQKNYHINPMQLIR